MKCGMCMLISTRMCEGCEEDSKFYPNWEWQMKDIKRVELSHMRMQLAVWGGTWAAGIILCEALMYEVVKISWVNMVSFIVWCVVGAVWIAWMALRICDRKVGVCSE